jgi:hypothetical protein
MGAKNIKVLVGENKIKHFKINENGNNFMDNLYDNVLLRFDN